MKLGLIQDFRPALIVDDRAIDLSESIPPLRELAPRDRMPYVIEEFTDLEPRLRELQASAGVPLSSVVLGAPLTQPTKILSCVGNYREGMDYVNKIDMFLKSSDSIVGPNGTVVLPDAQVTKFHHEAELAVVIGRTIKGKISETEAEESVFGYTGCIDVSGRGFGGASFIGKSFDTFAPLGPWIVTRDEIPNIQNVQVTLSVDDELRQNYNTDDMEHPVRELVAWAANVMTLRPGDLITCGTNHMGLGYIRDGERIDFAIEGVGSMEIFVKDPLGRSLPKGIDYEVIEIAKKWRAGDHSQVNV